MPTELGLAKQMRLGAKFVRAFVHIYNYKKNTDFTEYWVIDVLLQNKICRR